jgi:hypothetical protein
MNPHYPEVALRAGHRCEYCHAPEAVFNLPLEVEHIVPMARGGEDAAANWALACRFQVAPESGEIMGHTPIGRATVMRLGLNSAAQVAVGCSGCAWAFSPSQPRPN